MNETVDLVQAEQQRIVTLTGPGGTAYRRSADGAGKQHDADVSGLPVDGEAAVRAVARLPPRHKAAIFNTLNTFEIS